MRRILFLLLVLARLACPSWAASKIQSVTVAQLDQFLTAMHGQPDGDIAKGLESMALTERASGTQLAQWQSAFPGRHSREELTILSDRSAFLDPPAVEMLKEAGPDGQGQSAILSHARDYVARTLAKLPDFFATRNTEHFEGTVALGESGSMSYTLYRKNVSVPYTALPKNVYVPMLWAGESSVPVTYRDGAEMRGSQSKDRGAVNRPESDLSSAGEFGPILSVVLNDAMHGTVDWAYWQRSSIGKLAVFHYKVGEGHSSYVVTLEHGIHQEKILPAYHGEIAIDPDTGAVLGISVVASSLRSQDVTESAVTVDYSSITLGGKNYICPLRSVALLRTAVETPEGTALQTQLNDTTFTGYHLLRGDITILPAQR